MRRFLVVGCGGSGGATLAYMMDQLRSDLAAHGVNEIPAGWQFIHLDVPTAPSHGPDGMGNVRDQGGQYVGTGPQSDSYSVLDNAMSQQFAGKQKLDTIATWAPRNPATVHTPLSTGAGQFRALGRMITLSRAVTVRESLQRAWEKLFLVETEAEMRDLDVPGAGKYDSAERPVVLVVSSMAGGAGASMALDICRLLTLIPGVDPRLMGVFMVAPDIFDGLDASATTGVRANALAMLGEIVASQTGSAREHDVSILRALGQQNGEGELIPFARVFPVGRYVGAERTLFGDGTPNAVYRGLGRGLSALMMSVSATQQFVEWDLTNGGGLPGSREFLGWGNEIWDPLPWGTFGFASLSMGRDRYAEYSAQRLARSSADKLLRGHVQIGNPASEDEQAGAILDSQWGNIRGKLGLPAVSAGSNLPLDIGNWVTSTVLPSSDAVTLSAQVVDGELRDYIPSGNGLNASSWVPEVNRALSVRRAALLTGAQSAAYSWAYRWHLEFARRLEGVVAAAIAELGLPYATALVKRVSQYMQNDILTTTQDISKYAPQDIAAPPEDVRTTLAALRGNIANANEIVQSVLDGARRTVERQIYASLSAHLSAAAGAMVTEVFDPLIAALNESHTLLRQASLEQTRDLGLARLQTSQYAAWPSDSDERVPSRFAEANNEVMLTSSADFKQRYEFDLPASVGLQSVDQRGFGEAVVRAGAQVITGQWQTLDGTRAPGEELPLVERIATWRSRVFPTDPGTGESIISSPSKYDVHTRPAELLSRARLYVARTGESFDKFCSVSLQEFVTGVGAAESELAGRHRDVVSKFGQAISLAKPLASVNEQALQAIHGDRQMEYRFKFSSVPFRGLRVGDDLVAALDEGSRIDEKTKEVLRNALSDEKQIKRIDIFGSYPNYSPLAYNSVLEPAARQWLESSPSQRKAFWTMRRARPLAASLPMHGAERRALVAGWILGQILGRIHLPQAPFVEPARIWDEEAGRWLEFPNPLLTPPSEFSADYDWLPAVLESVLLAMAQSHEPPVMSSMLPYRALRRIYDGSAEDEVSGIFGLSAATHLTEWLRTGSTNTGVGSSVPDTGESVTVQERAERVKLSLQESRDFAGRHYMPPGSGGAVGEAGAVGGGVFSTITVRAQASKTPIFRDVAPDVFWATGKLISLVDECALAALRPKVGVDSVVPQAPTSSWPASGDAFEIPQRGAI
ncbi:tubulin-like doman-containing protein [Rhodococcus opacus]|uniref:tubulin-like doman-containing protein n=1 Tax=Rhodococcus opacus TaxID=37919 RepID=UPI0029532914|nr:tubulin-like doman-containing protein [Rhodococcus opacus]MDV7087266.1 tubulin-like doman-containing protein [Rhodococcus opacus]